MADATPTRQRLMEAGMRLFAERGFDSTSVGDIEAAVGLQPRRGGLYKHFASKQDLLEAVVADGVSHATVAASQIQSLDLGSAPQSSQESLRPIVSALGRWFLLAMDGIADVTRVIEHDSARLAGLAADVNTNVMDVSYRVAADLIGAATPAAKDPEAMAVALLGSLVALRRTTWTFGKPPLDIDDDRALAAWTDMTLATFDAARSPRRRRS